MAIKMAKSSVHGKDLRKEETMRTVLSHPRCMVEVRAMFCEPSEN